MNDQWTLVTYTGISAVVVMLVGGLKKMWPTWIAGKEPHLGLVFSITLGVAAKLTMPGAFAGVHWVVHVVSLILVSFAAKIGHDYLVNEVVKGKEPPK